MPKEVKPVSFQGYLLKINDTVFPNEYIAHGSYTSTPNQRQDLDSYRDAVGVLHRTILGHHVTKIEFNTIMLHLEDKTSLTGLLRNRDEMRVEYWNDEKNAYSNGNFYCADLKFEIYSVDEEKRDIRYKPIRIALIEY